MSASGAARGADGAPLRYRRILLKLSGEALLGDRQYGVDPSFFGLSRAPEQIVLCVATLHPHKNIAC